LYRETFYVCRNCGKDGETIAKQVVYDSSYSRTFTVRGTVKWGWGSAAVVVPFLMWMRWWQAAAVIGATLLSLPAVYWRENRRIEKELASRGLPRPDAPGRFRIPPPTAGCSPETVRGRPLPADERHATGPCCENPDWIEAFRVKDDDRVPCPACGHGVMVVSDHAIH
jgi:DNA-directed RNA polymerase subunit RPC12/RpoP